MEIVGQTRTKEYAVYGEVYLSDGVYMDEELYTGTFYRCKVFSKEVNTYEYPEVVGAVTVGWSEQYYEEREDNINNNSNLTDDIKDEELEKLELEAQKDIREKSNKFYGKTVTKGKYYKDNKSAVQARDAKRMWVNGKEVKKTRTRDCSSCGVRLTNSNTYKSHLEGRDSRCKACWSLAQKETLNQRMFVNGKYVPKKHPLYKAGRYKGFEEAAFSSLENYKDSAEGEVYIITNKAWPEWIKVGMAVDSQDRLKNYQTSSPFRDYVLYYSYNTDDRRKAESEAHSKLDQLFERNNEWFKCTPQEAKGVLNEH